MAGHGPDAHEGIGWKLPKPVMRVRLWKEVGCAYFQRKSRLMHMVIKAIIFDIGGVVISDDFLSFAKRFEKTAGMSKERIYRSVIGSPEWRLYFKGKVSGKRSGKP